MLDRFTYREMRKQEHDFLNVIFVNNQDLCALVEPGLRFLDNNYIPPRTFVVISFHCTVMLGKKNDHHRSSVTPTNQILYKIRPTCNPEIYIKIRRHRKIDLFHQKPCVGFDVTVAKISWPKRDFHNIDHKNPIKTNFNVY